MKCRKDASDVTIAEPIALKNNSFLERARRTPQRCRPAVGLRRFSCRRDQ
jgi:hypothetical protein